MDFITLIWTLLFSIWSLAGSCAIGVLSINPARLGTANALFVIFGISLFGLAIMFGITVPIPLVARLIAAAIIGALAASITVACLYWVAGMEPAKQALQSQGILVGPKDEHSITNLPKIEIGNSGTVFTLGPNSKGMSAFSLWNNDGLTVDKIDGRIVVSTAIRAKTGELVATIEKNEWSVAPPPKTWDKNYKAYGLEVINPFGEVVLQDIIKNDRVQIQGVWWGPDGNAGFSMAQNYGSEGGGLMEVIGPNNIDKARPAIKRFFKYPSALHFGELN